MATYTPNYNLYQPDATDPIEDFRSEFNTNMGIIDNNLGGGGSGGHTIVNENGVDMPAESKLHFTGNVTVTDDSTNGKTVVNVPSSGGGGDSVSWTQIQQSGTKIAEIDINGTSQDVYAPNGGGTSGDIYVEGVFTDANNMIWSQQINSGSQTYASYDYVATEDCLFVGSTGKFNNDTVYIAVDGKSITTYGPGIASDNLTLHVYLKKGQTATFSGLGNWASAKAYGLTQGTNGIYAPVIYSDTERKIGVWRDNKPLYSRTFTHSGALTVDNSFSNNIGSLSNVDQFVKCEGYFRRTNANGMMYSLNGGTRPEAGADTYKVTTRFYNGQVQVAVNGYNDIEFIALTVFYTKTTDTASGADWDLTGALIPRATLLWSGSFSGSGDISVPHLDDYLIIAVQNDVSTIMIGNYFTGSGALGQYQSGYPLQFAYRFGSSGANTITINNDNRGIMYNGGTTYGGSNWCTITKIYGLFRKPV